MNQDLVAKYLAKIISPQLNGKNSVGTGFPISAVHILTAKHVLGLNNRNHNHPIIVEFPGFNGASEEPLIRKVTNIAFCGADDLDCSVVELDEPISMEYLSVDLCMGTPQPHWKWYGFGYPIVRQEQVDTLGEKIPVMGKIFPSDQNQYYLSLTSEGDALGKTSWKGLSGAPVVSQGLLYGVIVDTPKSLQERFTAISISSLLNNHETFKVWYRDRVVDDELEKLRTVLRKHIISVLFDVPLLTEMLKARFGLESRADAAKVADQLLNEQKVSISLRILHDLLYQKAKSISVDIASWNSMVTAAETVVCWLLLGSVQANWLWNQGLKHGQYNGNGITTRIELQDVRFSEVVISRWLMELPVFEMDPANRLQPGKKKEISTTVFDAINLNATSEEILLPIYRDLMSPVDGSNLSETEMLDEIISHIKYLTDHTESAGDDSDRPKLIYYFVDHDKLKLIEGMSWYGWLSEQLEGRLQFVNCTSSIDTGWGACTEDQKQLLTALNRIMLFRKPDEQSP